MIKRDEIILSNILDIIEEIQSYCEKENCTDHESFGNNNFLKRAVAMCLISISEMITTFSKEFQKENSHININQFRTVRNIAAHNYGAINFSMVWDIINIDLPVLQNQLEKLTE